MNVRLAPCAAMILGFLGGSISPALARAQGVTVAPPVVVIDHKNRGGSLDLYNPSRDPVEVAIELRYGYPVTDSLGAIGLASFDTAAAGEPTAAPWIDIYPKRLTVLPGKRETVRFLARPPATLADREYWSRIIVTSKGGAIPVTTVDSGITGSLNVTVRTITTLLYRKGPLTTSLHVSDLRTDITHDSIIVRAKLVPFGPAAWLGTIRGSLINAQGKTVATFEHPIGIYHPIDPAFSIPLAGVEPGNFTVLIDARTERLDVPRSALIQAPPVHAETAVVIGRHLPPGL